VAPERQTRVSARTDNPWVGGFGLEGEDTEHALAHSVQRLASNEALDGLGLEADSHAIAADTRSTQNTLAGAAPYRAI